jgi:hypothetical protein
MPPTAVAANPGDYSGPALFYRATNEEQDR